MDNFIKSSDGTSRPLHACMLAYTFYETDGRVMRYAEALQQHGASVDAIVLQRPGQINEEILNGIRVVRVQQRSKDESSKFSYLSRLLVFFVISMIELSKRHFKNPYDIIHVHSVPDFEVFATMIPKLLGSKVILDIHDIVPEFYAAKFQAPENSLVIRGLKIMERLSASFADHVIAANDLWLHKISSRSVKPQKCSSFINYPDTSIFTRNMRRRTEDGKFRVVYPGSLNEHQGVDLAIKAVDKISSLAPGLSFDIYGEGPAKANLQELVISRQLTDRIRIHPPLPIRDIASVMADADLGVVPKRNEGFGGEAFSTKTLEFMALGIPIVLAKTRIDEHYFNESVCRFFTPGSEDDLARALLESYEDRDGNARLVDNAYAYATDLSWKNKKLDYLKIVHQLCGAPKLGVLS